MAIARRRNNDDEDEDGYVPPPGGAVNNVEAVSSSSCCGRCLSHKVTRGILKFAFSNAGLCIIVILYTIGGGFLMQAVELGEEKDANNATRLVAEMMDDHRIILGNNLKKLIWRHRQNRDKSITLVKKHLDNYHENFKRAIQENGYDGTLHLKQHEKNGWEIASALLFTATILTTIGYGHVFPVTEMGQLVMLLYSLFAIPLMSMFLINIGSAIADGVRYIYQNGCCRICRKKRVAKWKSIREQEIIDNGGVAPNSDELPPRPKSAWSIDADGNPIEPFEEPLPQVREEDVEETPRDVPGSLSLLIVLLYLLMGTLVFQWTEEDWTLTNSFYFTFITLSTVGFGDFVPGLDDLDTFGGKMRLAFTAGYIIIGLAVLAMGVDLATAAVAGRFSKVAKKIEEKAVKKKFKNGEEEEYVEEGAMIADTPNPANDIQLQDHFDDITPPAVVYR